MSNSFQLLPNLASLPNVAGRATTVIYQDTSTKIVLLDFLAGQNLPLHSAAFAGFIAILSGEATLELGEDTFQAKEGFVVHMAAGLTHSIHAVKNLRMLLILQLT